MSLEPRHTSLGDIDGDGDLDIVTSAFHSDAFAVFKNDGSGTFSAGIQLNTGKDDGARHTSQGDLNGDGVLDILTSASNSNAFEVFLGDTV